MRFMRPGHVSADADASEATSPDDTSVPPADSSAAADAKSDNHQVETAPGPARSSEGARILIEKIDALTSRLQACEQTIERMAQQMSAMMERQAAERQELEDRLRQQVERQVGHKVADAMAGLEQRQKESLSKQARLLELLAAEIGKVRSIAEARPQPRDAGPPGGWAAARGHPSHRRSNDAGGPADPVLLDPDELLADLSSQGPANTPEHGRELEFWDWLDQLPREVPEPRDNRGYDLDDFDGNKRR